jgi:hypothetical protein
MLPVRPPKASEDAPQMSILRNQVRDRVLVNGRGGLQESRSGPNAQGWVKIEKIFAPRAAAAPDIGTVVTRGWTPALLEMQTGAPNSCMWTGGFTTSYQRGDWNASIHGGFELTSTADIFHIKEFVQAKDTDKIVFERHWDHSIKRDLI